jgi:hypothetical protein
MVGVALMASPKHPLKNEREKKMRLTSTKRMSVSLLLLFWRQILFMLDRLMFIFCSQNMVSEVPVVKINMNALLNVKEDPELTILWIQALESARSVRANQGAPLKGAVKNALAITTNEYVKTYLKKSMKMFRKNSAGFTKRAVIWLVDKVSSMLLSFFDWKYDRDVF